jgi:hypothetical protein
MESTRALGTLRAVATAHCGSWQISGKRRLPALRARNRPGGGPGLAWWFGVEPPAGIEPATPSLPWNHQEPLCEPPYPQLTPDRQGQSYRFSFDGVMRSLSSHALLTAEGEWPALRAEAKRLLVGSSSRQSAPTASGGAAARPRGPRPSE